MPRTRIRLVASFAIKRFTAILPTSFVIDTVDWGGVSSWDQEVGRSR